MRPIVGNRAIDSDAGDVHIAIVHVGGGNGQKANSEIMCESHLLTPHGVRTQCDGYEGKMRENSCIFFMVGWLGNGGSRAGSMDSGDLSLRGSRKYHIDRNRNESWVFAEWEMGRWDVESETATWREISLGRWYLSMIRSYCRHQWDSLYDLYGATMMINQRNKELGRKNVIHLGREEDSGNRKHPMLIVCDDLVSQKNGPHIIERILKEMDIIRIG